MQSETSWRDVTRRRRHRRRAWRVRLAMLAGAVLLAGAATLAFLLPMLVTP